MIPYAAWADPAAQATWERDGHIQLPTPIKQVLVQVPVFKFSWDTSEARQDAEKL